MGLEKDIVIVNEFTIKNKKTQSGSRGSSPGRYLERYMSRDGASDKLSVENYTLGYMAREGASEALESSKFNKGYDKYSDVAFSNYEVNLGSRKLKRHSKSIQNYYEQGKTVLKTVLSFSNEYLKEKGVIPEDLDNDHKYCYQGNYDQLKLRLAIMEGLKRMGRYFDDLFAVGVIQVDTKELHCHLVMVDRGEGTLAKDGTQVGKLSSHKKSFLRSGIDRSLDGMNLYKSFLKSSSVAKEKLNQFIRVNTYESLSNRGSLQFLLALLPENKTYWRYDTNRKEMKAANGFVESYVESLYENPKSGYYQVKQNMDTYIEERVYREGLDEKQKFKLKQKLDQDLLKEGVNSVYDSLKVVLDKDKKVMTPMLHAMTTPLENLVGEEDELSQFTYRFRSYSKRMKDAKDRSEHARRFLSYYQKEVTSLASVPLVKFFTFEKQYYEGVFDKYQYFLDFYPSETYYKDELDDFLLYKEKLDKYELMLSDKRINRMSPLSAEAYCKNVYGHHGGQYLKESRYINEERFEKMQETFFKKKEVLSEKLKDFGLDYNDETGEIEKSLTDFDKVKWLDLHKLSFDFKEGFKVSDKNRTNFIQMVDKRVKLYNEAVKYLLDTNQTEMITLLGGDDVKMSAKFATKLADEGEVDINVPLKVKGESNKTISLDYEVNLLSEKLLESRVKLALEANEELEV